MTDRDRIAAFRRDDRAMPLSSEAWTVVASTGGIAFLLACRSLQDAHSRAFPPLPPTSVPAARMARFVVFAEKVAGKRPDRTLVLVRVREVEVP